MQGRIKTPDLNGRSHAVLLCVGTETAAVEREGRRRAALVGGGPAPQLTQSKP